MSTSSEMSKHAASMVSKIVVEDGCKVAEPSQEEIERLREFLDQSTHEIHQIRRAS